MASTQAWADASISASNPGSPTSGAEPKKRLVKRMVQRPATMVDVRRRTWKKFGEATTNESEITVKEKPVYLELGTVDPLEKACRDEIMTLQHNAQALRMEVPLLAHLQKLKREALAAGKKDAVSGATAEAAASQQAGSPAASPTSGGTGMTWAERNKQKRGDAGGAGGAAGGAQGGDKPKPRNFDRNVIRISNLVDTISQNELMRLFGPLNGLGEPVKFFQPKYKDGAPKQFCYITYKNAAEADAAVRKNNRIAFKNVVLVVDYGTDPNQVGGAFPRRN
jgi:hypothetical protein